MSAIYTTVMMEAWLAEPRQERVRRLYAQGLCTSQIAREIGMSPGAVNGIRNKVERFEKALTARARVGAHTLKPDELFGVTQTARSRWYGSSPMNWRWAADDPKHWREYIEHPRHKKITEMRAAGATPAQIGKEIGLTPTRINQIVKVMRRHEERLLEHNKQTILETLSEICVLHARNPHAIDNIKLLGELPPE
jgi:hypothetical protein